MDMYSTILERLEVYEDAEGYCSYDSIEYIRVFLECKNYQYDYGIIDWPNGEGCVVYFAWIESDGTISSISWEVLF